MKPVLRPHQLLALLGLLVVGTLGAQEATITSWTQSDMGGVGLLQMPSARMADSGEFSFSVNRASPYTRYNISVQPFSWLEGTYRYTNITNRAYGVSGTDQHRKDKSADIKLRLKQESHWWPAIAVGLRDVGGTGLFSGEYVVASKRFGNFDLTMGLGWGYVGARGNIRNPLGMVYNRFDTRPPPDVGEGGKFNGKSWFRGPMSVFGGIEYQTPWQPLRLKIEYDGNNYQHEPLRNDQRQKSPINLGLVYRPSKNIDLVLGWERGDTALFGLTLHGNLGQAEPTPKPLDPPPETKPEQVAPAAPANADWAAISQRLQENAGYEVHEVSQNERELFVTAEQRRYFYPSEAFGRASLILDNALGPDIDWFTIVDSSKGMKTQATSIDRQRFQKLRTHDLPLPAMRRSVVHGPAHENNRRKVLYDAPLQRYRGGFGLNVTENIGGPDAFVLYRVNAAYDAEFRFNENLWLSATAQYNLFDNYDKFTYDASSRLPRVRTNIRQYLTHSRLNMPNLQLSYAKQLAPNWYGMAYGGYLESMYAGAGGEILYRPANEAWALGANINRVRKRAFSQHFGFRDYRETTGHVTAYVKTGIQDILAKVSAGRYLAGDWGGTLDLSRQFDNGVRMGVWATLTNVSSEDFGEGSFDKGFYISIPFDLMLPRSTTSRANLVWQPLIRDGGAMLNRRYDLYGLTSARDPDLFNNNFNMIKP